MRALLVGDSLVQGYPLASGWRWPLWKKTLPLGVEYVGLFQDENGLRHAGFNGHRLQSLGGQMDKLLALRPDVVVLLMGGNGVPDQPADDFGPMLRDITRAFTDRGAKMYVCTLPDVRGASDLIASYNREIRKAVKALKGKATLVELSKVLGPSKADNLMYADHAHPTQLGAQAIADVVALKVFGVPVEGKVNLEPRAHFGASNSALFAKASAALLEAYPTMTRPVRQIALGIGWAETRFGQEGSWVKDGVPSNNWGGLTYVPSVCANYIEHGDHDKNGNPVTYRFCAFPTLTQGAIAWYETWAKPDTLAAARNGDAWGVSKAMYGRHYYTGTKGTDAERIDAYARMILGGAGAAASALSEPLAVGLDAPVASTPETASTGGRGSLLLATLGGAGVYWYLRRGKRR